MIERQVVASCDYKGCIARAVVRGADATRAKALLRAVERGFAKRGVWLLCREHKNEAVVLR